MIGNNLKRCQSTRLATFEKKQSLGYSVNKFGGSSVAHSRGFKNVTQIVNSFVNKPSIIVLSALGKTTNALEGVVEALMSEGVSDAERHLERIEDGHKIITSELGLESALVEEVYGQLKNSLPRYKSLTYDKAYDAIVSYGELCSSRILFEILRQDDKSIEWLDAREIIATNGIHRDATVDWEATTKNIKEKIEVLLASGKSIVTQGFIGGPIDSTTTLGREGSDYSAAIFAYCIDANDVTIWKDVVGVLTGDPRDFENVVKIDRLSYREAIEMTYYGAKVIHPKTIKPLQNKSIALQVRSFEDPSVPGTLITHEVEVSYPPIVVVEKNQALLHISTRDFSFVAEHHMSVIFKLIAQQRIKINMMRNTAISFTVCVTDAGARIDMLIKDLSQDFVVKIDRNMELVTIRHYNSAEVSDIVGTRPVIFEEKIKDTLQMVVRKGEGIKRK